MKANVVHVNIATTMTLVIDIPDSGYYDSMQNLIVYESNAEYRFKTPYCKKLLFFICTGMMENIFKMQMLNSNLNFVISTE